MTSLNIRTNFYKATSFLCTTALLTTLFICCIIEYIITNKLKWRKQPTLSNKENETKLLPNEKIHFISSKSKYNDERPNLSNSNTQVSGAATQGSSSSVRRSTNHDQAEDITHQSTENPYNSIYLAKDDSISKQISEPTYKLVADLKYYYQQYGLDIEKFRIITNDGYELDLWHVVGNSKNESSKNPVLFIHGLLQSSGSFASSGLNSLAYYVRQNLGRDVWLGNNRCGLIPGKRHAEGKKSDDLWDWDLNEMSKYDLPCLVDYVLKATGKGKLDLIGHSQGTMQSLQSLINYKKIDTNFDNCLLGKVENFVALAPAIYPGALIYDNVVLKILASIINSKVIMGTQAFIPLMMYIRNISVTFGSKSVFSMLSYLMFKFLFDWNDTLWDKNLKSRHFLFSPVFVSIKLMQFWLSENNDAVSFKNGKVADLYFPDNKVWFPINNKSDSTFTSERPFHVHEPQDLDVYPKMTLFVPKLDKLVDGNRLCNHFTQFEDKRLYQIYYIDDYSHLDVLWSMDVIEVIGKRIAQALS
ncbi:related to Sterol esterase 2 [Hanseniaspora guilliermondii]|uniref:Related to Sterol esterase 2 n=1 Tax=Hanseniaspora guilliermondii TaxID=56406 RepID=A0A1L0B5V0_9ASCO|nr:related to Sterol esterase 2 [Hanseniaspora guilliermondii]